MRECRGLGAYLLNGQVRLLRLADGSARPSATGRPEPPDAAGGTILSEPVFSQRRPESARGRIGVVWARPLTSALRRRAADLPEPERDVRRGRDASPRWRKNASFTYARARLP